MELIKLKGIRPFSCAPHFAVEEAEAKRWHVANPEPESRSLIPSPVHFLLQQVGLYLDSSPHPQKNIAPYFKSQYSCRFFK